MGGEGYDECDFTQIDEYQPDEIKKEVVTKEIGPTVKIANCKCIILELNQ